VEYLKCGNTECPKIPTKAAIKDFKDSPIPMGLVDFKSDDCGFLPTFQKTFGKRERAIIYSLFMRSLIENAKTTNPRVLALQEALRHLEGSYYRKNAEKYTELLKISQISYKKALKVHDNTHIAPFLVVNELFLDTKNVFTGNFGVNEALFTRIMANYQGKSTEEEEENAIKVFKTLVFEAEKGLNDV